MKDNNYIPEFKSVFKDELQYFIEWKRLLGYKYNHKSCDLFKTLDIFFTSEKLDKKYINNNLIENWLKLCEGLSIRTKQNYYSTIKMFTEFLVSKHYKNIVLPKENPFTGKSSFVPYIYTKNEINSISEYLKNKSINLKHHEGIYSLFCLIYCCGLRIGEAVKIKFQDFDIKNKTILLNKTKNDVKRLIPLSNSLYDILIDYIEKISVNENHYIFYPFDYEKRNSVCAKFRFHFKKALNFAGVNKRYDGKLPRVHDLRHTFAVNTLKQMQEKGFDLYTSLPILSVYLGHKSIAETEHYLRLIEENYKDILSISQKYTKGLYGKKVEFFE